MDRLLIVDGSNLLFQMFYGMPTKIIGKSGKAVQGTVGFVGALLKIIRITRPTHVAVLFDGESQNERVLLDADYKANRPDYSALDDAVKENLSKLYHSIMDKKKELQLHSLPAENVFEVPGTDKKAFINIDKAGQITIIIN